MDINNEYCPSHSVCEKPCENDELECSDGVDAIGCTRPRLCINKGTDIDGEVCESQCPEICGPGMKMCEGNLKQNGCRAPGTCVEIGTDCAGIFIFLYPNSF